MSTKEEFDRNWPKLPLMLKDMLRNQTLKFVPDDTKDCNSTYLTGYVCALHDCQVIDRETYSWALIFVNSVHRYAHLAVLVRDSFRSSNENQT